MKRFCITYIFLIVLSINIFAQFGICVGVNTSEQVRTFVQRPEDFSTDKLTGFQAGVVWQNKFGNSGFGTEIGAMFAQKGSYYSYNSASKDIDAHDELNYIDVPLNIRFTPPLHTPINIYGIAGMYLSYLLGGKSTNDTDNTSEKMTFQSALDRIDVGASTGVGVQIFGKIQLGVTWNWGFMKTPDSTSDFVRNFKNKNLSVNLTYIF